MTVDRCPNCGEYVPSTSTVCPKCYSTIPKNAIYRRPPKSTNLNMKREKSETLALMLALIPPIFGLQGLGLIYLNHENRRGWYFLGIGLVLFLLLLIFVSRWDASGTFSRVLLVFSMIILSLIYISSFVAQLLETRFGTVLGRFRY